MTLPTLTPAGALADLGSVDVDRIAAAVLGCPSVAALHGGLFGEIATYLPGRRVPGVRTDTGTARVEVHVVGHYPAPVAEIAAQVRAAVTATVPSTTGPVVVDVTVEDYLDPTAAAPGVTPPVVVTSSGTVHAVPPAPVVDHIDVAVPSSQE